MKGIRYKVFAFVGGIHSHVRRRRVKSDDMFVHLKNTKRRPAVEFSKSVLPKKQNAYRPAEGNRYGYVLASSERRRSARSVRWLEPGTVRGSCGRESTTDIILQPPMVEASGTRLWEILLLLAMVLQELNVSEIYLGMLLAGA